LRDRPHLLLFPASLRRQSHQRRLIEHFVSVIGGACHTDVLAPEAVDLPLFNQDLEADPGVVGQVMALHERWRRADGFIVSSPEYNGHAPPFLKNTVDWISRLARIDARYAAVNPFGGKPLLLASASTGWTGGILGLRDARTIFAYLGCLVSAEEICVASADHWAAEGRFRFEPAFAAHIEGALTTFRNQVARLAGLAVPEAESQVHA